MVDQLYWLFLAVMTVAYCSMAYVDSSTWWLRALSDGSRMGQFIGRTNIYNYFGRSFAFVYTGCLSFLVDTGHATQYVALFIGITFLAGAMSQRILLNRGRASQSLLMFIAHTIRLSPQPLAETNEALPQGRALFLITSSSTFLLSLALSLPYIVASIFPEFRLTISSTSQVLNSLGTILVLTFVDQMLFALWDKSGLAASLPYFMRGRITGMTGAGTLLILGFFAAPYVR